MPEKKKNEVTKILFSVLGAGTLFFSVFGQIWGFLEDTNLTWLLSGIGAVGIGALIAWLIKRIENKDREERNRVKSISDEKSYYGEAFSQWLIKNKIDIYESRIYRLLSKVNEWGSIRVQELIEKEIVIGMTEEMVKLSLGEPLQVEPQEENEGEKMIKWVYEIDEKDFLDIWIKDNVVIKIKETPLRG